MQQRRRRVGKFAVAREAVHGSEDEGDGGPDYSGDDGGLRGRRLRGRGRRHPTQFKRLKEDVGRGTAWVDATGGRNRIVTGKAPYFYLNAIYPSFPDLCSRRRACRLRGGDGQCRRPSACSCRGRAASRLSSAPFRRR